MMRKFASFVIATSFSVTMLAPSLALAQANCEWYAKAAVRQQQINETSKCMLVGPSWHKDLAEHQKWCNSVPPDLWKAEARKRTQDLEKCTKG